MRVFPLIMLITISQAGCELDEGASVAREPYRRVTLNCVDFYAGDGAFQVVINTQSTLDSLMYENFQRPAEELWAASYPYMLGVVQRDNPGLTDSAYALLARERMYDFYPGLDFTRCVNSSIDFSSYTLVGQTVNCGGCTDPGQSIRFTRNVLERSYTFSVVTTQYGYCDVPWEEDLWLLVPKISPGDSVRFVHQTVVKEL
jgi:hypothetical protein